MLKTKILFETEILFNNFNEMCAEKNVPKLSDDYKEPCFDQYVAIIEITDNKVVYIKNEIDKKSRENISNEEEYDIIAILLESPYTSEYEHGKSLGPAMGTTGINLSKYLLGALAKYILLNDQCKNGCYFRTESEILPGKYCLLLINPVQFKCKDEENDFFGKIWEDESIQKDFINRLKSHKPSIIINCCTIKDNRDATNNQKVQKIINKNFPCTIKLTGYHPSSSLFPFGFKKVKD